MQIKVITFDGMFGLMRMFRLHPKILSGSCFLLIAQIQHLHWSLKLVSIRNARSSIHFKMNLLQKSQIAHQLAFLRCLLVCFNQSSRCMLFKIDLLQCCLSPFFPLFGYKRKQSKVCQWCNCSSQQPMTMKCTPTSAWIFETGCEQRSWRRGQCYRRHTNSYKSGCGPINLEDLTTISPLNNQRKTFLIWSMKPTLTVFLQREHLFLAHQFSINLLTFSSVAQAFIRVRVRR